MSHLDTFAIEQDTLGLSFGRGDHGETDPSPGGDQDADTLVHFLATGLGSRGGPNKASNKLKSNPGAYLFSLH